MDHEVFRFSAPHYGTRFVTRSPLYQGSVTVFPYLVKETENIFIPSTRTIVFLKMSNRGKALHFVVEEFCDFIRVERSSTQQIVFTLQLTSL